MHWGAIFRLRCPRCLRGPIFKSLFVSHENCPECGLKYAREPGFFLGAMYFSYGLGILLSLPLCGVMFYHEYSPWAIFAAVIAQLSLLSPLLLRYSRAMWLHFDQRFDPR
jgi:uncharacterized protein (DUF983 family)